MRTKVNISRRDMLAIGAMTAGSLAGFRDAFGVEQLNAQHRLRDPDRAVAERETVKIAEEFFRAWENPDADVLTNFFSMPCTLKYGHSLDIVQFSDSRELRALFAKTIVGGRKWKFDAEVKWVRGPLMICQGTISNALPGKPYVVAKENFLVNVQGGKVAAWYDFGYFDITYPSSPNIFVATNEKDLANQEKATMETWATYQQAWEESDAERMANLLAEPAALKYLDWSQPQVSNDKNQALKLLQSHHAGPVISKCEVIDGWVRGSVVVQDVIVHSTASGKSRPSTKCIHVAHVRDGKVRQWLAYKYDAA